MPVLEFTRIAAPGFCGDPREFPKEPGGLFFDGVPIQTWITSPAHLHDSSIWGAHSVAQTYPSGEVTAVRWFQIDISGDATRWRMVQDGRLASQDASHFYPSIAVDGAGNMGMVLTVSGPNEFGSAYFTGRRRSDPPNTVREPVLLQPGRSRWDQDRFGYYQGAAVDPADDSVWMIGLYVLEPTVPATWLGQLYLER